MKKTLSTGEKTNIVNRWEKHCQQVKKQTLSTGEKKNCQQVKKKHCQHVKKNIVNR